MCCTAPCASGGYACDVIAPSLIPTRPGVQRKHDKRDATDLARYDRAGELVVVRIPSEAEDRVRDVVRGREVFQREILTSRHSILTFLARRGFVYREGTNGCTPHRKWRQHLTTDGSAFASDDRMVFREDHALLDYKVQRRAERDRQIEPLALLPHLAPMGQALQCVRGIARQSAMVLATARVDGRRFAHPRQLACELGVVPRDDSSGNRGRLGSITKAGNTHGRHVLIPAAWSSRHRPQTSVALNRRQQGQAPAVITHAMQAPQRLHQRFQSRSHPKRPQIAVVAVARELVGFLWAIARDIEVPAGAESGDRGAAWCAAARCASTPDGVMQPGSDAGPGAASIEWASSRRIQFVPRCHTVVIGVYQQDSSSMLP